MRVDNIDDNPKSQKHIMGIPVNDKLGLGVAACDHHIPVWGGGKGDRLIGVTATAEAQVYIHLHHSVISINCI